MAKFVPINDRILFRVLEEEEKKSAGGIILPVSRVTATIAEVGPGAQFGASDGCPGRLQMTVKKGDVVALPKNYKEHSEEVLHDGAVHYVSTEQVVLGVLVG
jgi:co-chaperonin GroES (HSP10)